MPASITTHILDTSSGKPAGGVTVRLEVQEKSGGWKQLGGGATSADGRVDAPMSMEPTLQRGRYRLTFETSAYFQSHGVKTFYPYVQVVFDVDDPGAHYHVPLLLSPFGYSTYRGS